MRINRVLDYYYKAYNKAATGQEAGRQTIEIFKDAIGARKRPALYERLKKLALRALCGPLYWPNTFPTAIDEAAAGLIYSLVRLVQPETAVEIGTAYGNSAIAVGQALEDNKKGKLYTIDPASQEIVKIAVKKSGLGNRIEYILGYSYDVIPKLKLPKIDFVFIDGDHFGENPMNDFNLIKDFIRPEGVIVFHDSILFPAVRNAVAAAEKSGNYEVVTFPTLSGSNRDGKGALFSPENGFTPAGLTIMKKSK